MRELKAGDVVDGLVIKERVGKGGMGDVYLAHDERLAVNRALKIISLTGPGFTGSATEAAEYRQRFLREARTLARLRHPNIITVHASGEIEGNAYLVMSHFPSKDARHWLHDQAPTLERVRRVAVQAAQALAHAHERGVLHRDLKLSNLLVGENDEAMLIDFGLAKSRDDSDLTRTGRSMGTFSYLAPEYVKASTDGKPKHTIATDLWAFGCVLYALTCCKPAFREQDQLRLLRLIEQVNFAPVKTVRPKVPDDWAKLIHELMEPDVARRMPSAAELVRRLEMVSLARVDMPKPVALSPPPRDDEPDERAQPEPPQQPTNHAPASVARVAPVAEAMPNDAAAPAGTLGAAKPLADGAVHEPDIFDTPKTVPGGGFAAIPETTATAQVPQPSFQQPAENAATSQRESAKRKLLIPIAAALAVLVCGGGLIIWSGTLGGRTRSSTYVDPEEVERQRRAERELADLDGERQRRHATQNAAPSIAPPLPMFAPLRSESGDPPPAAEAAAVEPHAKSKAGRQDLRAAGARIESIEVDPWRARYGTRTSFNTSSSASATPASAGTATQSAVAGIKIPVRVTDAIASAPIGPVIATVQATTKIGALELPRGAQVHGRITGAEGPRILVEFTFAIVDGRNVSLKGTALGADGRAGVPGAKSIGGVSDVGSGAAGGATAALVDAAVGLVDNDIARRTLQGGAAPAAAKAGRLNNQEDLVVAERGARFFVYVESAS